MEGRGTVTEWVIGDTSALWCPHLWHPPPPPPALWCPHLWHLCTLVSSCGFHLYLALLCLPMSTHCWIKTVTIDVHVFLFGLKRKGSNTVHIVKEDQFLDESSVWMTALPFPQFTVWLKWIDFFVETILEIYGTSLNSQEMLKLIINYYHLWFIDKH